MTSRSAVPFLSLAIVLGGCPKRQTGPRIVYVPAPAPSAAPAKAARQQSPEVLVIEQPAPEEAPAPPPPAPEAPAKPPRPETRHPATEETRPTPPAVPATVPVPSIEPHESAARETEMRGRVVALQQDVQQRIARLSQVRLSGADRMTLETARAFLAQSNKALKQGDLARAQTLAEKASLLTQALAQ